jgi:AmmeMemoRadiSam system protein B
MSVLRPLASSQACGWGAVVGLLIESPASRAFRLALCNSGDTAGSRDRVVGYGVWMFAKAEQ